MHRHSRKNVQEISGISGLLQLKAVVQLTYENL